MKYLILLFLFPHFAFAIEQRAVHLWHDYPKNIRIPVHWELTKSAFVKESIVTETENFNENWQLILKKGLGTYLKSPRATVEVSGVNYTEGLSPMPRILILKERDLARLLGLKHQLLPPPPEEEGDEPVVITGPRLVMIHLDSHSPKEQVFNISFSNEEYYQVNLTMAR